MREYVGSAIWTCCHQASSLFLSDASLQGGACIPWGICVSGARLLGLAQNTSHSCIQKLFILQWTAAYFITHCLTRWSSAGRISHDHPSFVLCDQCSWILAEENWNRVYLCTRTRAWSWKTPSRTVLPKRTTQKAATVLCCPADCPTCSPLPTVLFW